MIRHCLLIILLCLGLFYAEGQPQKDSSRNKIADKLALMMAKNCALNDSAVQVVSDFCYDYLIEIKKLGSANADVLIRAQKTAQLRTAFQKELKEKFGSCVFKNYRKIIDRRNRDRSRNKGR